MSFEAPNTIQSCATARSHSLELSTAFDHNLGTGSTRSRSDALNLLDDVHTLDNGSKDDVLAIQPCGFSSAQENCWQRNQKVRKHFQYQGSTRILWNLHWEPLVLGPALAMDKIPAPVCLSWKFSSGNFPPENSSQVTRVSHSNPSKKRSLKPSRLTVNRLSTSTVVVGEVTPLQCTNKANELGWKARHFHKRPTSTTTTHLGT